MPLTRPLFFNLLSFHFGSFSARFTEYIHFSLSLSFHVYFSSFAPNISHRSKRNRNQEFETLLKFRANV